MSNQFNYLSEKYKSANIKEVNERLIELSSLFEISQILNSSLELNHVLNNVLLIPMGRMMISRGMILIKKNNYYVPRLIKGLPKFVEEQKFYLNEIATNEAFLPEKQAIDPKVQHFAQFMLDNHLSVAIPIASQKKLLGLALYGQKLNKKPFTEDEINFLKSLANISGKTIENALQVEEIQGINKELDQRIQQLKTLFDIARGLSATLDQNKIKKLLTYALMGQMLINRYALIFYNSVDGTQVEAKGFLKDIIESIAETLRQIPYLESAILIQDIENEYIQERLVRLGVQVLIPMRHQNKLLGIILLGEKINKNTYSTVDLDFLSTLVSQAVVSLENARLFQETLEKQRIEQELQVARQIQKKLLPKEIPQIPGYDVFGINISSKEVGGDYFDIMNISDYQHALAIADVSGKSVPASLLMANLQAGLRLLIKENIELSTLVGRLNNLIYQNTDLDRYITFFIGILDSQKNIFRYVNAGHNPPLIYHSDGTVKLLEEGGLILGMLPEYKYQTGLVQFTPGDLFVAYTDGVTEALNTFEEEFGEERLINYVKEKYRENLHQIAQGLIRTIKEFTLKTEQADDITLLLMKKK